jgi:hypothetical protein
MKKYYIQATVLLLSLFLSVTAAQAQTTTVNAVVRTEIPLEEGKLIINLPDDIRAGDVISGTVSTEPKGERQKEKDRNNSALLNYTIHIGGSVFTPAPAGYKPMNFVATPGTGIRVRDSKLIEVFFKPIIFKPIPTAIASMGSNSVTVPTHALTGAPLGINGNFDGDIATTRCFLDGKDMEILAESPRQSFVTMPQASSGQHNITVQEKGRSTERKVSAVNMDLSATRTDLLKGQTSTLTVALSGLQGLSSDATITLTNTSPSTISLSGGNTQTITVSPSQVSNNGGYTQNFTAQSLATGAFSVNADLQLPQTTMEKENTKGPCDEKMKEYEAKKDSCKKKNCDKELENLNAAKQALEDAKNNLANAQNALNKWNDQFGGEQDALNSNMGNLQSAALNAANALAAAKQALIAAMKKALESSKGANDGLAFGADQLTESRDHYTEVYPGIFVYSHNPSNSTPQNAWDRHVRDEVDRRLGGNSEITNLRQQYLNALANNTNAGNKLNEADARREALNEQRMTLINAVNNAQAALQKAEKDLKDKEDAYNNCLKDVARICKEAAQLKLAIDSCNHAWGRIQEVTKAITGSSANPQNGNPKGTASAEAIAKATQEAGKAREALNKGDYGGAEQHARNADNLRMEADKTKGLEEGLGKLRDSETSLEKKLEDAKKNHAGNYDQVQKDIDKLKADVKEMENAIAKNDLTTAGRIYAGSTKEAGQLSKAIDKAIIDADIAKKRQEDYVRRNTPKPQPKLGKPINPDDQQLKFFARTLVLEKLYRDEAIRRANGRECD